MPSFDSQLCWIVAASRRFTCFASRFSNNSARRRLRKLRSHQPDYRGANGRQIFFLTCERCKKAGGLIDNDFTSVRYPRRLIRAKAFGSKEALGQTYRRNSSTPRLKISREWLWSLPINAGRAFPSTIQALWTPLRR